MSIYTWSAGDHAERIYRRNQWRDGGDAMRQYFCAANGQITYSESSAGVETGSPGVRSFEAMRGALGEEVKVKVTSSFLLGALDEGSVAPVGYLPRNHLWSVRGRKSILDCDEHGASNMVGSIWAYVGSDDGAVLFDQPDGELYYTNPRVVSRVSGHEKALPFGDRVTSPACFVNTPWDQQTWLWSCDLGGAPTAMAQQQSVWRLTASTGEVVEIKVPMIPSTHFVNFLPSREGLFFFSSDTSEEDGLFRFVGGLRDLIVRGEFIDGTVSPDGCRFALSESLSSDPEDNRLVVIDVCKGN